MLRTLATRSLTRRSMVRLGAGLTLGSVLAACGQAAPPTNTPAPAKPAEAPKPAAAPAVEPTKPAAAAPATAPAAAPTQAPAPAAPAAATKPSSSIKINGN